MVSQPADQAQNKSNDLRDFLHAYNETFAIVSTDAGGTEAPLHDNTIEVAARRRRRRESRAKKSLCDQAIAMSYLPDNVFETFLESWEDAPHPAEDARQRRRNSRTE